MKTQKFFSYLIFPRYFNHPEMRLPRFYQPVLEFC